MLRRSFVQDREDVQAPSNLFTCESLDPAWDLPVFVSKADADDCLTHMPQSFDRIHPIGDDRASLTDESL